MKLIYSNAHAVRIKADHLSFISLKELIKKSSFTLKSKRSVINVSE